MNKRNSTLFIPLALLIIFSTTANAQRKVSFQQAVGIGAFVAHQFKGVNFTNYEARINYAFTPSSSVSMNFRGDLGYGRNNYRTTEPKKDSLSVLRIFSPTGISVGYQVFLSYNFGNAATRFANKALGGAFGVGYNETVGDRNIDGADYWDQQRVQIAGLFLDGKFNFPIGNSSWTLDANYTFDFRHYHSDIHGLFTCGLYYNINVPIHGKRKELRHLQ